MSEKNPIRVFVTHAFTETDDYLRVFEFLESVDRFYYVNVSRPENVPPEGGQEALKDELIAQIKMSEIVVIVMNVVEQDAALVTYMMDVADANELGMIAVQPFAGIGEVPSGIADRVRDSVAWNERAMVDAITFQARGTETQRWEVVDFPGWDADGELNDD